MKAYRPDMHWLQVGRRNGRFIVHDARTGRSWLADTMDEVHQLAADLSSDVEHYGLGDAIHAVASGFGFRRCTECAKRQVALNRAVPALTRRRRRVGW